MTAAEDLIARFELQPHPEGGYFRENWRGTGTAAYYLLRAEDDSRWHRSDALEIWHHYAGAPLRLVIDDERPRMLGSDEAQMIVPARSWQCASTTGDYSFVGRTAFELAASELAPPRWQPPRRDGYHELGGPYELVRYEGGRPISFASLGQALPAPGEEAALVARIEKLTSHRVRLTDWVIEQGDPRDNGRTARIEIVD